MTTTKRRYRTKPPAWYAVFLACLHAGASVTEAARLAGVSRDNAYKHAEDHPEFAAAWKAAEQDCQARIRTAARDARKTIQHV